MRIGSLQISLLTSGMAPAWSNLILLKQCYISTDIHMVWVLSSIRKKTFLYLSTQTLKMNTVWFSCTKSQLVSKQAEARDAGMFQETQKNLLIWGDF